MNKHSRQSDFRDVLLLRKGIAYMGNFHLTDFIVFIEQQIIQFLATLWRWEAWRAHFIWLAASHLALSAHPDTLISEEGMATRMG